MTITPATSDTAAVLDAVRSAVALETDYALIRVTATYEAAGGPGSKVFPPTYPTREGRPPYLLERRRFGGDERPDVVLDTTPPQANRAEEALLRAPSVRTDRDPTGGVHQTNEDPDETDRTIGEVSSVVGTMRGSPRSVGLRCTARASESDHLRHRRGPPTPHHLSVTARCWSSGAGTTSPA